MPRHCAWAAARVPAGGADVDQGRVVVGERRAQRAVQFAGRSLQYPPWAKLALLVRRRPCQRTPPNVALLVPFKVLRLRYARSLPRHVAERPQYGSDDPRMVKTSLTVRRLDTPPAVEPLKGWARAHYTSLRRCGRH
jgi:hypothetical protein